MSHLSYALAITCLVFSITFISVRHRWGKVFQIAGGIIGFSYIIQRNGEAIMVALSVMLFAMSLMQLGKPTGPTEKVSKDA